MLRKSKTLAVPFKEIFAKIEYHENSKIRISKLKFARCWKQGKPD